MVKTNHFMNLNRRNLSFDTVDGFEDWSHTHQQRAEKLMSQAKTIKDLKAVLTDRKNSDSKTAICTTSDEEKCYTHSAFIFDTKNAIAHYAQGNPLEVGFKKFGFE